MNTDKSMRFKEVMETLKYSKDEQWNMARTIFDINAVGDCIYVNLLGQKNSDGNYDIFVLIMNATIKLSSDVFMLRETTCEFCLFS